MVYHEVIDKEVIEALGETEPLQYQSTYFFEKSLEGYEDSVLEFLRDYWMVPFVLSALYVVAILFGKWYMSRRPRFELRTPLTIWSGILAIFSIMGAARSLPELIYTITNYSFTHSVCHPGFYYGISGFWAIMFTLSKPYELGDTAFIVSRKQPLIFLHWYHHITVMLYCWLSYPEHISAGRWFQVMNYIVHAFMYTYYTMRALKVRVPRWISIMITSLQIIQMIVGCLIFIFIYVVKESGGACQVSHTNLKWGLLMYLSYFMLFGKFFYHTYIERKTPQTSEQALEQNESKISAVIEYLKSYADIEWYGFVKKDA